MNRTIECAWAYIAVILASPLVFAGAPRAATDLPGDVLTFIGRRTHCDWLSKKQLSAPPVLRCDAVPQDETALRRQYGGDARVISALNDHWEIVVQRVPVQLDH